jgi:hypothetical protein
MSSTNAGGGNAGHMAYIVTKQNRFYVVTYDGINPTTGKEQRRWHLVGESRDDAEAIAANRPSTAHRYRWMIDHYIVPAIGHLPLRALRAEHPERLYRDLRTTGGTNGTRLAPKTVYDVPRSVHLTQKLDTPWGRYFQTPKMSTTTSADVDVNAHPYPRDTDTIAADAVVSPATMKFAFDVPGHARDMHAYAVAYPAPTGSVTVTLTCPAVTAPNDTTSAKFD